MDDYVIGLDGGEVIVTTTSDPYGLGSSASSDKFAALDEFVSKIVDEDAQTPQPGVGSEDVSLTVADLGTKLRSQ